MSVWSPSKIDYNVIATGSKGNAVRIGEIMIDCGIPFARMKEELYRCHTLLITHTHSDHIKPKTLTRIMSEFPRIRIYGNADVAYQYPTVKPVGTASFNLKDGTIVTPYEGIHDVPVTYYVLQKDGVNVIYATDTSEVFNPLDIKFDWFFLESNYDEKKLEQSSIQYARKGYDPTLSSLRHLSTKQCKTFYYMNRKGNDSKLIELHMSERFY